MQQSRVLVLGGAGFIGRDIVELLTENSFEVIVGSRTAVRGNDPRAVTVDAENSADVRSALDNIDAIVNCVTGSASGIETSARVIAEEAGKVSPPPRIVHMSSMAIYGAAEGVIAERSGYSEPIGWYGNAKRRAEETFAGYAESGGPCTILRIGCVVGPSSTLWVDRIGLLLRSGRLGDLGELGDGWSNLVNVRDISRAVLNALLEKQSGLSVYNVAAPDSPRWNSYFKDLALSIGAVPLKYKTPLSMQLESKIIAPPAKLLERLSRSKLIPGLRFQSIPPSLLRLWAQQILLDSKKITKELRLGWTPYGESVNQSAKYFISKYGPK